MVWHKHVQCWDAMAEAVVSPKACRLGALDIVSAHFDAKGYKTILQLAEQSSSLEIKLWRRLETGYAGSALCLDERDLHVSIAGLVSASEPLMTLASTCSRCAQWSLQQRCKSGSSPWERSKRRSTTQVVSGWLGAALNTKYSRSGIFCPFKLLKRQNFPIGKFYLSDWGDCSIFSRTGR